MSQNNVNKFYYQFLYNIFLFVYQIFVNYYNVEIFFKKSQVFFYTKTNRNDHFALIKVQKSVLLRCLCTFLLYVLYKIYVNKLSVVFFSFSFTVLCRSYAVAMKNNIQVDVCMCDDKFTLSNTISTLHWRSTRIFERTIRKFFVVSVVGASNGGI